MYIQPIILRDKDTGAGQTGLNVDLYSKVDGVWTKFCDTNEVAGYPGVYLPDIACPYQAYRLKVGDVYDNSWDGNSADGRMYGDVTTAITAAVAAEAALRVAGDATAVHITGDETVAGIKTVRSLPQAKTAGGVTLVPVLEAELVPLKYLANYIPYIYGLKIPSNVIIVDASLAAEDAQHYLTIQAAINKALSLVPTAVNQYYIWIIPHKNRSTGYGENITMQNYVHLIGFGGIAKIIGNLTGAGATNTFENIFWQCSGNFTLTNLVLKNSLFCSNSESAPTVTLSGNTIINSGIFSYMAGGTGLIVSSGGNIFINSYANGNVEPNATDKGNLAGLGDASIAPVY